MEILKLPELVIHQNALFMYNFFNNNLPELFNNFFFPVTQKHNYNTRHASRSSYSLPRIRTNYGKFNIRFSGAKVWNDIDDEIKKLKLSKFKKRMKNVLLSNYIE